MMFKVPSHSGSDDFLVVLAPSQIYTGSLKLYHMLIEYKNEIRID